MKRRGEDEDPFVLHSGEKSRIMYDVNAMLTNHFWMRRIISFMITGGVKHYVGIPTGGTVIAAVTAEVTTNRFDIMYSLVKDGELKGEIPIGDYLLIDDVVTTEGSLNEALDVLDESGVRDLAKIYVVVDRRQRDERKLNLTSMFDVGDQDG